MTFSGSDKLAHLWRAEQKRDKLLHDILCSFDEPTTVKTYGKRKSRQSLLNKYQEPKKKVSAMRPPTPSPDDGFDDPWTPTKSDENGNNDQKKGIGSRDLYGSPSSLNSLDENFLNPFQTTPPKVASITQDAAKQKRGIRARNFYGSPNSIHSGDEAFVDPFRFTPPKVTSITPQKKTPTRSSPSPVLSKDGLSTSRTCSPLSSNNFNRSNFEEQKKLCSSHLIGLPNTHNNCYLSSVLQMLISPPLVREEMLGLLENFNSLGYPGVLSQLRKYGFAYPVCEFVNAWCQGDKHMAAREASKIKKVLEKFNPDFSGMKMQDAAECLLLICDKFREQINRISSELPFEEFIDPFMSNYACEFEQIIRCRKCGQERAQPQGEEFALVLNLAQIDQDSRSKVHSIQELMVSAFKGERIEYRCERCETSGFATKSTRISRLPRHLMVHLGRFEFTELGSRKIKTPISVPRYLDLSNMVSPTVVPPKYNGGPEELIPPAILNISSESEEKQSPTKPAIASPSFVPSTSLEKSPETKNPSPPKRQRHLSDETLDTFRVILPDVTDNKEPSEGVRFSKGLDDLSIPLNITQQGDNKEPSERDQFPKEHETLGKPSSIKQHGDKESSERVRFMKRLNSLSMSIPLSINVDEEVPSLDDVLGPLSHPASEAIDMEVEEDVPDPVADSSSLIPPSDFAYSLTAIVKHFGDTTDAGHYVVYLYRHEQKQWYEYDDTNVRALSFSEVFAGRARREAYILGFTYKQLAEKYDSAGEQENSAPDFKRPTTSPDFRRPTISPNSKRPTKSPDFKRPTNSFSSSDEGTTSFLSPPPSPSSNRHQNAEDHRVPRSR